MNPKCTYLHVFMRETEGDLSQSGGGSGVTQQGRLEDKMLVISLPSPYMHALSDTTPVQNLMLALSPSNSPIASLTFNGMVFGGEAFGDC